MTWHVVIRPNAEADLREACAWYESRRAGLGDEILTEIDAAISLLERDPERRPVYYRGFRRMIIRRFPYKMFYRIEHDRVIVFRILHAKRKHQSLL